MTSAVDAEATDDRTVAATDREGTDGRTATVRATTDDGSPTDDRVVRKKCALITGCSSGIGRATAKAFLDRDWLVVATSRNPDDIAELAEAGCETAALDVTRPEQVTAVVEDAVEYAGAIDCVVNNAGYAQMGPLEDISTEQLHRQFDVNVYGPHRLTRAALPHMRAQGDGRIVNVSSVIGRISVGGAGAYAGSKHALEAMSDALRVEVEGLGIDVVLIEPGPVESAFVDRVERELPTDRTPAYEQLYELYEDAQLIGGGGPLASNPQDVADAIVHASTCSDPPARYPVGTLAQFGSYARFLPDRLRDAVYGVVQKLA